MAVLGVKQGQIVGVCQLPSTNCDARPEGQSPEVIIVHAISLPPQNYGGGYIEQLFSNSLNFDQHDYFKSIRGLEVSAHFLIGRSGSIKQFVSTDKRAWHAGQSECLGKTRVNDFSIGIELEGCDEESFTKEQYHILADLIECLIAAYPDLSKDKIYGHSDIAPGRKTDPGPHFSWTKLRKLLAD